MTTLTSEYETRQVARLESSPNRVYFNEYTNLIKTIKNYLEYQGTFDLILAENEGLFTMTNLIFAAARRLSHALMLSIAVTSVLPAAHADALKAEDIVKPAQARARHEKKNVFVYFHASWRPWCRRLDKLQPTSG